MPQEGVEKKSREEAAPIISMFILYPSGDDRQAQGEAYHRRIRGSRTPYQNLRFDITTEKRKGGTADVGGVLSQMHRRTPFPNLDDGGTKKTMIRKEEQGNRLETNQESLYLGYMRRKAHGKRLTDTSPEKEGR